MRLQHRFAAVGFFVGFSAVAAHAPAEEVSESVPIYVRTMIVPEAEQTLSRQFFGRVAARDTVSLAFEVGGELASLEALEGAPVTKGAPIAQLDLAPFQRAVERAQLTLVQAERDLARTEQLAAREVASEVNVQNAQTARDLAEVALRDARAALADARITAPFDGLIADRIASAQTIVEPGEPIVRLHDLSEIRVEFDLPERLFQQVGDIQTVRFSGVRPGGEDVFPLEFREFRAETGPIGQSYTLSLAATGSSLPQLLPGQTVVVQAVMPDTDARPTLPAGAIATTPEGSQIVVVVEQSGGQLTARHKRVQVMAPTGSALVVDGLPAKTEIVAVGAHAIDDGAPLARYQGLQRGAD